MTYCVGMLMKDGFVLAADTRTNAGLDNIATFKKLHSWSQPGKRVFALATSGNLATTQAVVSLLSEGTQSLRKRGAVDNLFTAKTMFQAAQIVGALETDSEQVLADPTSQLVKASLADDLTTLYPTLQAQWDAVAVGS